jgi:carotenoid 1,2-hydratase
VKVELPTQSGAYRWVYLDVSAGDLTAVAIFMIGSVFSPRYSAGLSRGALPLTHSAVNFALYDRGARWAWVLTEYPNVSLAAQGRSLRIGQSSWQYTDDGRLSVHVIDKVGLSGQRFEATLDVTLGAGLEPLQLVPNSPHWWWPLSPRGEARVRVPSMGVDVVGRGYHDSNFGSEPLGGTDVPGWRWARLHGPEETRVLYEPPGERTLEVTATSTQARLSERAHALTRADRRTGWGLRVPSSYQPISPALGAPTLLESSPFYARLEATGESGHLVGEVADFRRFHQPWIRWMAKFRTRVEAGA